jgi:hypothetical protein
MPNRYGEPTLGSRMIIAGVTPVAT